MNNEEKVVAEVYKAINQNDILKVIELFDPEVVVVEPEGFPMSGTYRGHKDVREHFIKARDTWSEGSCDPEEFKVFGNKVIAFVHVRVRLKNQQDWIDGKIADVFTFHNGKITEMRIFADREKAIEWVQKS